MTLRWTIIFQFSALFFRLVVATLPIISPAWMPVVHGVVDFCQAGQAVLAVVAQQSAPHDFTKTSASEKQ